MTAEATADALPPTLIIDVRKEHHGHLFFIHFRFGLYFNFTRGDGAAADTKFLFSLISLISQQLFTF